MLIDAEMVSPHVGFELTIWTALHHPPKLPTVLLRQPIINPIYHVIKTIIQCKPRSACYLTHLSQINFPISISRTSLLQILGVLGGIFHLISNFNRKFCKQTVETLIRRRVLRRLIWVSTVCLCPTKRTLGLNGLRISLIRFNTECHSSIHTSSDRQMDKLKVPLTCLIILYNFLKHYKNLRNIALM